MLKALVKVGEEKEYTHGLELSPFICINYKGRKVGSFTKKKSDKHHLNQEIKLSIIKM